MLANGTKLYYKPKGGTGSYTELSGVKNIPELGVEREKVENSDLGDSVYVYELGIGDPGDVEYTFKYVNTSATDSYRLLRAAEASGALYTWKEETKDGTTTEFDAYPSVKRGGGGINDPLEFTLTLALQSDFTITDPSAS